jgi:hypothetical protein
MAFLNPIFLLGAIAAGVPVLVHLVRRTRARREPFPSLMFLRRIEQKTIRRRTLRNLLLLALRCLALLLLAFAFARPYFPSLRARANSDRDSSSVILVDVSYSMRYSNVMDRAKEAAINIARNAGAGERIAVASFGQGFQVLSRLDLDHQLAITALDHLQAGLEATDYEQAILGADALLKEGGSGTKRIQLISDFQATGWDRSRTGGMLSADVRLVPVDVGDSTSSNVAVSSVRADPVVYSQKYAGKVTAQISNFSMQPVDVPVELRLNELALERRQLSIGSQSSETIEFTDFNVPPGSNRATVEITGDDFTVDNRYFFTIKREDQQRILVIETPSRGRSESFFLQQALAAGENEEHTITVKTPGTVNPTEVDSYRAVVVNDAGGIGEALSESLKKFVEQGGGLVIAAGGHVEPGEFNKTFSGIAPAQIGDTVQGRGYSLMSQIRTEHPLFSPFARSGRIASPRIYAHRACTPNDAATTAAALDDGSPIIVDGAAGKGRVVLITTTLDTSWNDLPLTPIYVPLVRQMLDYLRGGRRTADCLLTQSFRAVVDSDGSKPEVDAPGGGRVEDAQTDKSSDQLVQAGEAGFYRLKYRDRNEYVAVNLDTRESDLTRLKVEDLIAAFSNSGARPNSEPLSDSSLTAEQVEARQRIWLPLLLLALSLFVVEAALARRIRVPRLLYR